MQKAPCLYSTPGGHENQEGGACQICSNELSLTFVCTSTYSLTGGGGGAGKKFFPTIFFFFWVRELIFLVKRAPPAVKGRGLLFFFFFFEIFL